jgi:hypothetical protein
MIVYRRGLLTRWQCEGLVVLKIEQRLAWYTGLLLLAILSMVNSVGVAAESQFLSPVVVTSASPGTFAMVAVDLDKDGDIDLVVASSMNDTVAWYENIEGIGQTWVVHTVTSVADGVVGVSIADIDRDGDVDIVSASTLDDKLRWHENLLGNGVSWSDHTIGVDIDGIIGLVVEDFDQDLDWDVAAVSNLDDQVLWFENTTGDASDGLVHLIAGNAFGAFPLAKGDLDGDGDQDLISGWSGIGVLAWHENVKNEGGEWVNHVLASNLGTLRSIAVDDINGDGVVDVLVAASDLDSIFWFQGIDIPLGIWQRHSVTTTLDGVLFIDTVDLDNDGDTDVVAAADLDRKFVVYDNGSGLGSNWSESVLSSVAMGGIHEYITNGPRTILPADVNGDGLQDIITGSYWGQTVSVLIQKGLHQTSSSSAGATATPTATPAMVPTVVGVAIGPAVVVRPSPIVVADFEITEVSAASGIVEIVQPTKLSTISGMDHCEVMKVPHPSWRETFQVKLIKDEFLSIPLRIRQQSLCNFGIETYDVHAVENNEMELWQQATIAIPLSDLITQQLAVRGVDGLENTMKAIADRRLVIMKRHLAEGSHWVPVSTHMDLLGGNITTRLSGISGTYALLLLEEPLPQGSALPSVGGSYAQIVVWVACVVGLFLLLAGILVRSHTARV